MRVLARGIATRPGRPARPWRDRRPGGSLPPLAGLALALVALSPACLAGCATGATSAPSPGAGRSRSTPSEAVFARYAASSRPVGRGARFQPPPRGPRAARGAEIGGMACASRPPITAAAHVELFAEGRVVIVPAGVGLAPPLRARGARIVAARCAYPLRTLDPSGLVLLGPGAPRTLADLFALWGQPLTRTALAGFRTSPRDPVTVFVNGAPRRGDPGAVPLAPGSQVTVELGARVPPHAGYTFPSLAWARP